MRRILFVEDDIRLSKVVVDYLELEGFRCEHLASAEHALEIVKQNTYDVIVTDVNMHRMSGFDFCRKLREQLVDTPVIMLTSRSTLNDKEQGFLAGADDYISKPFELKELVLRINAVFMRVNGRLNVIKIDELNLEIDTSRHSVKREGEEVSLSKSGWKILLTLAKAWPNPVTKEELEYALWGDSLRESDGLKAHVRLLRLSLDKPFSFPIIKTVSYYGYCLGVTN